MFRITVLLCSFATSVLATDECAAFTSCLTSHKNAWIVQAEAIKAAKMAEAKECFTNHGCTVPVFNNTVMVQMEACVSKAETAIEACVLTKTNQNISLHVHRRQESHNDHEKHGEEKRHMEEEYYMEKMLNASCAANISAVHYVGLCLKGLTIKHCPSQHHDNHNPEVHKIHMDICHEHFTKQCEEQMNKVEEAIWECSRNDATSEAFRKCIPAQNHTDKDEKPRKEHEGKDEKMNDKDEEECKNDDHKDKHDKKWEEKLKQLKCKHAKEQKELEEEREKEKEKLKREQEVEAECKKKVLPILFCEKCEPQEDKQEKHEGCPKKHEDFCEKEEKPKKENEEGHKKEDEKKDEKKDHRRR